MLASPSIHHHHHHHHHRATTTTTVIVRDRATGGVLKDQDLLSDGVKFELGDRRGSAFVAQVMMVMAMAG
jgi:hypothetical protein